MLPYVDSIVSTMQSGAKIMGHLYYHTALPPCRVECRIEKWSNSLFRKREGGIFEAVGDSIIDLGGVKTQEAAAKGRRRQRRTEEETPLNFLVLFFKSDKWLAKMSEYYYSSCSHFAMPFLLWLLIVILATRKVYSARRRGNILL